MKGNHITTSTDMLLLVKNTSEMRRKYRLLLDGFLTVDWVLCLFTIKSLISAWLEPDGGAMIRISPCVMLLSLGTVVFSVTMLRSQKWRNAINVPEDMNFSYGNVSHIGSVIDCISLIKPIDKRMHYALTNILISQLEAVNHENSVTPCQLNILHEMLLGKYGVYGNIQLRFAIIKALREIGNRDTILYVQRLAQSRASVNDVQLQDALSDCLTILSERLSHERNREMLMRPLETTHANLKSLLIPTTPCDKPSMVELINENPLSEDD